MLNHFDESYERQHLIETLDSIYYYKTKIKLQVDLHSAVGIEFPAEIRLTKSNRGSKIHFRIDLLKIWLFSVIGGGTIAIVFYLLHPHLFAFVIGTLAGLFIFTGLWLKVRRAFKDYVSDFQFHGS